MENNNQDIDEFSSNFQEEQDQPLEFFIDETAQYSPIEIPDVPDINVNYDVLGEPAFTENRSELDISSILSSSLFENKEEEDEEDTYTGVLVDENGNRLYLVGGMRHRVDGPAEIASNGDLFWYRYDELHNPHGPAVVRTNGEEEWYWEGLLHRVGGPAITDQFGNLFWYQDGELHNEHGPAIIRNDGTMEWYVNGIRHNSDRGAPAIVNPDGSMEWFWHGEPYSGRTHPREIFESGDMVWDYDAKNNNPNSIIDGVAYYFDEQGNYHNETGGPAIIYPDGSMFWYRHGLLHRDNGEPAIVQSDGVRHWYQNGLRHRNYPDPAVINSDGSVEYWMNGVQFNPLTIFKRN